PPPAPRTRSPAAGEIQDQTGAPLSGQAAAGHSRPRAGPRTARCHRGPRLRRPVGHLVHRPPKKDMRQITLLLIALLAANLVCAQGAAPKRKSGLWEITRTSTYTQDKPKRIQLCVDEASDNALLQLPEGM